MSFLNKFSNIFKKKSFGLSALLPDYSLRNQPWNGQPLDAYYIDLYVNKALEKRGQKVGEIEFIIEKNGEEIDNHPLLSILNKPNEYFDGPDFWKVWQIIKDIHGEAYIWVEASERKVFEKKGAAGLHLLDPKAIRPVKDRDGILTNYEYNTGGKAVLYPQEEIIRSFRPDPGRVSSLGAISLLEAGKNNIHTNIQLAQHQANIIKNGGKVEGVFKFKTDGGLTKDQLREIKEKYKTEYSEAKKAGMPLFLGGDSEYIRMGLTPAELAYLESKKVTLEDICILTEVPKAVLASVDDIKYSNAETVYKIFLSETVEPLAKSLCRALSNRFFKNQEGMRVGYRDFVPESREEKRKDLETADKINALTINEKRNELGYDPVPDGDKILIPFSLVELGKKPEEKKEEEKRDEEKKDEEEKEEEKADPTEEKKGIEYNHPLKDFDIRRKYFDWKIKKLDKRENEAQKMLENYFDGQVARLNEKIKSIKNFKKKDLIDERFDIQKEAEIAANELLPLAEKFLIESGQESLDFINYPHKFLLSTEIQGWLQEKAKVFGRTINETTFERLKQEFAESLAANESRAELVGRIKDTYGGIKTSRAAMIARTEVLGITQKGSFEAYKQAMIPIKIWSAIIDPRTRGTHAMIDGEERPIGVPFSNGLQFPGDPSGPAREICNCRCII